MNDKIAERRHPEWVEHERHWRWLLDSYEGSERYRKAIYGNDNLGMPVRNLIRHKREYPDPRESGTGGRSSILMAGSDPASEATVGDYEMRLARTPVPTFVADAVDSHLSPIYVQEIEREGPDDLIQWWRDVDGKGTPASDWMADTFAPLLLTLGQLDILCDRPEKPEGSTIRTKADEAAAGLNRCIASVILPENMVWWKLSETGSHYAECLVREYCEHDTMRVKGYTFHGHDSHRFRHWTATESTLYDSDGGVISTTPHDYGRVPIVRLFDRRKARCSNVGQSRYASVAECMREYYNRDSELILSDTTQAHPLLQGPEDYIQSDGTIPIGPSWLLPKKKNSAGGSATYEGFDVVDFPKDGAESIRLNKADLIDRIDRSTKQTKPAGASGTSGQTVGQSGVSKRLDQTSGNLLLGKISKVLARAERKIAELALIVLGHNTSEAVDVDITYPTEFDLATLDDLIAAATEFQALIGGCGDLPAIEADAYCRIARLMLPGKDEERYAAYDLEIQALIQRNGARRDQASESMTGIENELPPTEAEDDGTDRADDQPDPESDPSADADE